MSFLPQLSWRRRPELDRLVIYIGHHKIGSSALQTYFTRNAADYLKQGILYPWTTRKGERYAAARAQSVNTKPSLCAREPHNALAFSMLAKAQGRDLPFFLQDLPAPKEIFAHIDSQIRRTAPHTLVLISEVFSNFAKDAPELIDLLRSRFPAKQVTLYAGFRRIDEYLPAWHAQRLKFGHRLQPLSTGGWADYQGGIHLEFDAILNRWLSTFPQADLILRDYRQILENEGSIGDFLDMTGLPVVAKPKLRKNRSLHRGVLGFQIEINRRSPHDEARDALNYLLRVSPRLGLPPSCDIELFGAEQRLLIAKAFAPSNRALGAFAGRAAFFDDDPDIQSVRPVSEMAAADIARKALLARSDVPDCLHQLLCA